VRVLRKLGIFAKEVAESDDARRLPTGGLCNKVTTGTNSAYLPPRRDVQERAECVVGVLRRSCIDSAGVIEVGRDEAWRC